MNDLQQEVLTICKDLDEYLKCTKCYRILNNEIYLCEAGHLVCSSCAQYSSNETCSICRMKYTKTRNFLAEKLMTNLETIKEKINDNMKDNDDDVKCISSESNNVFWKTWPCQVEKCKFQGTIQEIREHCKENHSGIYIEHCDSILPHSTDFFLEYAFPRRIERLLNIPAVGLFLLQVATYDNGALRAFLLMYDTGRNAKRYQYKLKVQCNAQNSIVEGQVDSVRIPKPHLSKKGLFVPRAHTLQQELQAALKFTCHVELSRNIQPPEQNPQISQKKKLEKNFSKNQNKSTNGNSQNLEDKSSDSATNKPNRLKNHNGKKTPIEVKSSEPQNPLSKVTNPLQIREGFVKLGGSRSDPLNSNLPSVVNPMSSYGGQAVGYQPPRGGINSGVVPPPQGLFPGANPYYRPPNYGQASAPVEPVAVQYPDLTHLQRTLSQDRLRVAERNGCKGDSKEKKSQDKCVIS
uniref:Siah2l_0 protein n=2 Tax=Fopius arisanus TaxID=64838 RepID=A0A0C9QI28_9HYME